MRRTRGCLRWFARTALLGAIVVPVVADLAFGALVLTSEATGPPAAPELRAWLSTALVRTGLQSARPPSAPPALTPTLRPTAGDLVEAPPRTGYVNDASAPLQFTLTPSPSPTETHTATASPSATPSATFSNTPTPSRTPSATPTPSPTDTWLPTPVPTDPPTSTARPTDTSTTVPPTTVPTDSSGPTATRDPAEPTPTQEPTEEPTSAPSATYSAECTTSLNAGYENTILELVNGARSDEGLHPLTLQSQLQAAARIHAADMACNHFTSHTGSDGSSVGDRVEAQGYSWSWIGENYMVTRSGPETAFNWWMNSTPHRNNILGSSYTEIGVGYIYGPDSDYGGYYVLVFARPG